MSTEPRDNLPPGTILDCYRIVKVIGSGGFSLIYLAEDEDTKDEVAIKEYLPKRFGKREGVNPVSVISEEFRDNFHRGRRLFYQEAKVLAQLNHPNIVGIRNCFLANNTAYLVMDYEPGKNLGRYIKKRNGGLSTNFLMSVFPPLLDALSHLHRRHHLHLDIKPSNIHLRPGGNPLLLDFGAVYHLNPDKGQEKAQVITPGFSPIEQYYASGNVGPWTDVYAVGASMRACLDGKSPPSSVERHANDQLVPAAQVYDKRYPAYLMAAIDWAMSVEPDERPQSADELRTAIVEPGHVPARIAATRHKARTEPGA